VDVVNPRRFEVFLVSLDPTVGSEMRKTRPCVIVSPDEANDQLHTVVIAPITSTLRGYPSRVAIRFRNRDGQVSIDHVRAVDTSRLVRRLGTVRPEEARRITAVLVAFFG
jgi:mRNA interferase MazF